MGFFTVNPLICRAVWAYAMLDSLDKPISETALLLSCFCAYRTFDAALGHFFIFFGYGSCCHVHPPELNWALQSPVAARWASINLNTLQDPKDQDRGNHCEDG